MVVIKKVVRYIVKSYRKLVNKNKDFTIICDSCVAGVIYNELSIQFLTPTINLYIRTDDFIKFVSNLEFYLGHQLIQIYKPNITYPVARLADIEIYFMHYHSFDDARNKWNERKSRINYENLYVVMTENEGCNLTHIKKFDELPFIKKVIFTYKSYPDVKSAFYIKGYEYLSELGNIIADSNSLGIRYYDQFPWIKWLNQKSYKI